MNHLPIAPHRASEGADTTLPVCSSLSVHPLAAHSAALLSVPALLEYIHALERRIEMLEQAIAVPTPPATASAAPSGSSGSSADALLTREAVAMRLQVSLRYVDQLVADGTLVPIRIGRNVRFHSGVIDAFIRASARQSRPIGFRTSSSSTSTGGSSSVRKTKPSA